VIFLRSRPRWPAWVDPMYLEGGASKERAQKAHTNTKTVCTAHCVHIAALL
jgi:hypothetical protein